VIFEGRTPSCQAVFHKVLSSFIWQPTTEKIFQYKACKHSLMAGGTLVCFDGADLPNGLCCGAGGTFKTHSSRITKWYLNCDTGSNNKAELMGLWASLYLASCWSLNHLLVLGDSRVIIDWINQKCQLHSIHIEGWKQQTKELATRFTDVHFQHFPRYHNSEVDALSERALIAVAGCLSIFHCDNGIESTITTINLFDS
jgi:ribonuclease HI